MTFWFGAETGVLGLIALIVASVVAAAMITGRHARTVPPPAGWLPGTPEWCGRGLLPSGFLRRRP